MLLKLYSYGKQELLQSLQHHQSVTTKNQLTPKSSLKYKESKNLKFIDMQMGLKMLLQNLILS